MTGDSRQACECVYLPFGNELVRDEKLFFLQYIYETIIFVNRNRMSVVIRSSCDGRCAFVVDFVQLPDVEANFLGVLTVVLWCTSLRYRFASCFRGLRFSSLITWCQRLLESDFNCP